MRLSRQSSQGLEEIVEQDDVGVDVAQQIARTARGRFAKRPVEERGAERVHGGLAEVRGLMLARSLRDAGIVANHQ